MLRISTPILGILLAVMATIPAKALDLDELTVVTLARDGSWGVATAGSQGQALSTAIRDCRAMAAAPSDCGAQFVTTRGGWVVANLCGDHKIIVAAESREAAEQAALSREFHLMRLYAPQMPPCRRVLVVDPRGAVLLGLAATPHQTDARRGELLLRAEPGPLPAERGRTNSFLTLQLG